MVSLTLNPSRDPNPSPNPKPNPSPNPKPNQASTKQPLRATAITYLHVNYVTTQTIFELADKYDEEYAEPNPNPNP